jgi:hypothetical protein
MKIDGVFFVREWAQGRTVTEFVNEFIDMPHIWPALNKKDKVKALRAAHAQLIK